MRSLIVVLAMMVVCGAAAQPAPRASTEAGDSATVATLAERLPGLADRLAALDPADPSGYLELGEEVAAEATTDAEFNLAERLFVLAFELERSGSDDGPGARGVTRPAACFALAEITPSERRARWLRAIARVIDPRYAMPDWTGSVDRPLSRREAFRAAEAIGMVRSGDGARARDLLERPEVARIFDRYSALLTGAGPSEVLSELEAEAARWPCPECRNERVSVKRLNQDVERSLCNYCGGNPGWALSRGGLIANLRFESAMLSGAQRSWGAQLAIDLGAPLRDPDPAEVAPTYRVDPTRPYWRDGRWITTPDASTSSGSTP